MVALIWLNLLKNFVQARKTLQGSGVKLYQIKDRSDPAEPVSRILNRYPPHGSVDFVALLE
jgi:hypothetical protein